MKRERKIRVSPPPILPYQSPNNEVAIYTDTLLYLPYKIIYAWSKGVFSNFSFFL